MPRYIAEVKGDVLELEANGAGLSIPLNNLCRVLDIKYEGQQARVVGNSVEIDPPRSGDVGASIPIESIFNFYRR